MRGFRESRWQCGAARMTLCVLLIAGINGCKTQDDAVAAAKQMTTTAATLRDYYDALDKVVAATQETFEAQGALDGIPAMAPKTLDDIRAQLKLRRELADRVAELAIALTKVTGATAAADSAKAAGSFNSQVVSLAGATSNDAETKAVTAGVNLLVQLVQQHDEVKAAKQVEPVTKALLAFFQKEEPKYDALNDGYLTAAKSVAKEMVSSHQVGGDAAFVAALSPFGLTPAVSEKTRAAMESQLQTQIDAEYKRREDEAHKATAAMADALMEMDKRVSLVTHDQPMEIRQEPLSLKTVKEWIESARKETK
jgi:hypothetical protein